jgi:hypothetical protein
VHCTSFVQNTTKTDLCSQHTHPPLVHAELMNPVSAILRCTKSLHVNPTLTAPLIAALLGNVRVYQIVSRNGVQVDIHHTLNLFESHGVKRNILQKVSYVITMEKLTLYLSDN